MLEGPLAADRPGNVPANSKFSHKRPSWRSNIVEFMSLAVPTEPFSPFLEKGTQDKAGASSTSFQLPPARAAGLAHLHSYSEPVSHSAVSPSTPCHAHSCSPSLRNPRGMPQAGRTSHIQNTSATPLATASQGPENQGSKLLPLCRNAYRRSKEEERWRTNLLISSGPGTG